MLFNVWLCNYKNILVNNESGWISTMNNEIEWIYVMKNESEWISEMEWKWVLRIPLVKIQVALSKDPSGA